MNERHPSLPSPRVASSFALAFALFVATHAGAQVANPNTPTLDSPRKTDPVKEPNTNVVIGGGQPQSPVTGLTPGSNANPSTPTPGNNIDQQAASGLADARLAASQTAPVLTLSDALAVALRDNPNRKAAFAAVDAARARVGTAKAGGGFQVSASANASRTQYFGPRGNTNNVTGGTGTGGTGTGGTVTTGSNVSRTRDSQTVRIDGTLPITTGGRVSASTRVAQYNLQAQNAQRAQVEQDLIFNTTVAYLNLLRNQQLLDVTESNLDVSRERLRVARVRYDAGASARIDVLRAETDLATARQLRIQASNNLGQSAANFNTLLGRTPETPFRVVNITSLALPADLPLYITPAAASGGSLTTSASNAGAPGVTATTQTNPGVPGGNTTNTTGTTGVAGAGTTTGQPGTVGVGATQPGTTTGTGTLGGQNTVPGANTTNPVQGGTTTAPGNTTGTGTGTTAAGGTTTAGTVGVTPGSSTTTTGVTNQTPGTISSTGTATGVGANGTTGTTGTSTIIATANGISTASGTTSAGVISSTAGSQLAVSAGSTRQSLAVTQAQIQAAEANVDLAQAQRKPSVSINPFLLLSNPASFLGRFAASLGIGASNTLFSAGRIASQVSEARATVEQLRQNYSGQVLDVQNSIESSLLTLDSSQRKLASADTSVVSAREAVRAAQLGFEAGAQTALDVSDAQAALLTAQTDAVNARYDVATAQANLAATIGVLSGEATDAYLQITSEDAARAAAEAGQIGNTQPDKKKRRKFLGIF